MSKRSQLLNEAAARLSAAGASDSALDAQWMLAHVTGMPRLMLLLEPEAEVAAQAAVDFEALLSRRASGEPLQYVLGEAEFMGRVFQVDRRVLIPRPDTEPLCAAAIERIQSGMKVLDIGTGSGALAVSVALERPGAEVTAVDISADALAVAQRNAQKLGAKVRFVLSDLFERLEGCIFDVIVSNPPYIPAGDLPGLQMEVQREPSCALDGGPDGLAFYRRITEGLSGAGVNSKISRHKGIPLGIPTGHLAKGGSLLFEVGDGQAADVASMLRGHFDSVDILRDLAGLERVVIGDGYAG